MEEKCCKEEKEGRTKGHPKLTFLHKPCLDIQIMSLQGRVFTVRLFLILTKLDDIDVFCITAQE